MNELQKQLFTLQDPSYLEFHSKLIPTIEKNRIIGIRTPALRSFAKDFKGTKEAKAFLKELPHHYYEENNLHMMLISAKFRCRIEWCMCHWKKSILELPHTVPIYVF